LPTIDTSNITRLAIKDFENKSGVDGPIGAQLTQYLTDRTNQLIMSYGKFTIVAPADPNADGIFTGEIRSIETKDSQTEKEKKDKEGNPYTEITYKREVTLVFVYSVISSRTGMPIGSVTKQGTASDSNLEASRIADPLTLAKRIVDSQLRQLERDIIPTIESTHRRLMNETIKDKVVKERMKTALALVKHNNYQEAIRQFEQIADEYGSVAARTNAGILRQAIASDTAARTELAELLSDKDGLAEKAVKGAIDMLNSKLPSGAVIMIVKTGRTERNMLDFVVDQMTKTVVQGGKLQVVERSNLALINAEQEYQLSGNVDDDSIISIGHQLGAQYIVLCKISGEMSMRRLNVRVLNVETAEVTEQSDFDI
jgi:hypothetical protein